MRRLACLSAALGPLLLAGCADLAALRHYTDAAGPLVSDTAALRRWRDAGQHLTAWALPGDAPECAAPLAAWHPPRAEMQAAARDIAAVHARLGAWFEALGALAADELPQRPSQALAQGLRGLQQAGLTVDDADEAALRQLEGLLSLALDARRQAALHTLMPQADAPVARLLGLLDRLAGLYADDLAGEQGLARQFVSCEAAVGDLREPYLLRREQQRVAQAYAAEQAALLRYRRSLHTLAATHRDIGAALGLGPAAIKAALQRARAGITDLDQAHQGLALLGTLDALDTLNALNALPALPAASAPAAP